MKLTMNNLIKFLFAFVISLPVMSQVTETKTVQGIVKDAETGKVLSGITISVPDFSSVFTDEEGKFSLKIPTQSTIIEVSGTAYQKREFSVKSRSAVEILLYKSGYKGALVQVMTSSGVKSSIQSANLYSCINENNSLSVAVTPDELIQAYGSGVNSVIRSGLPGSGSNIYLRGFNTLNAGSQPLFIVDGLPLENSSATASLIGNYQANPLSSIDIKDIESITIMKDAVGLYGVKGGNGVIIIETSKAKTPETKINAHLHTGFSLEADRMPVLNANQHKSLLTDLLQSQYSNSEYIASLPYINSEIPVKQNWGFEGNVDYYRYNHNTDWQSQVYDSKMNQNYYMNVSGGDEVAMYMLSIGFLNQSGTIKNTNLQRFNTRFNATVKMTKKLNFTANMSFVYGSKNLANESSDISKNPLFASFVKTPMTTSHVYNADGLLSPNIEDVDIFGNSNPYSLANNLTLTNLNYRFLGSFELKYNLSKNLSISNLLGINYNKEREKVFYPSTGVYYNPINESEIINESQHRVDRLFYLYNDLNLKYKISHSDWKFNLQAGLRAQNTEAENDYGLGFNSSSDNFKSIQYGEALLRKVGGTIGSWNWMSLYANADFTLKSKYFFNFTGSADASSRTGNDASSIFTYPSIASAWLISGEEFMKDNNWLDVLKYRISYGLSGNDEIGNYNGVQYYRVQSLMGTFGLVRGNLVNTNLKPETVERVNTGFDISILNERLNLSLDFYTHNIRNMVLASVPDKATGFDVYLDNSGSMNNKGFDFSIQSRILNNDLIWDLGLNINSYRNTITNLGGETFNHSILGGTVQTREGQPLGLFYGYQTNGVYATEADAQYDHLQIMQGLFPVNFTAGDIRFVNQNNDNLIDEKDRVVIGNPNPDFTGSIRNTFQYKNWKLFALMTYSVGNDIYNYTRSQLENMSTYHNQTLAVMNRWRFEGNMTDIPKATYGDPMGNSRFSDRWIEDGSYIRIKQVQLSYELNLKSKFIQNSTLFLTGENLLTLTRYKGLDPEFAMGQSPIYFGIDACFTPQPRIISAGINLSL